MTVQRALKVALLARSMRTVIATRAGSNKTLCNLCSSYAHVLELFRLLYTLPVRLPGHEQLLRALAALNITQLQLSPSLLHAPLMIQ
jgi:hypothetical protein